jgi:recombination protein RecT
MTDQPAQAKALSPIQRVGVLLDSDEMKRKIRASLDGLGISPERFARAALGALAANPFVVERCTIPSVVQSILQAASLGLELDPRLGQAYLVPRRDQALLQIGVRGWIQMAFNTGKLIAMDVGEIHENDVVEYVRGSNPRLEIRPPFSDRGPVVAYYCAAQWIGGGTTIETMTRYEVVAHRDRFSDAWKRQGEKSPWGTDFDQMAQKTVIARARKRWPVSLVPSGVDLDDDGDVRIVDVNPATAPQLVVVEEPAKASVRTSRLDAFANTTTEEN